MAASRKPRLTHLDAAGRARMVDVGAKAVTRRRAVAHAAVRMTPATARLIARGGVAKGDVLAVARLAGVMAAKRTAELIPLCHPLPLSFVDLCLTVDEEGGSVAISAEARVDARTGVEMEALAAATVAALTVYDMCKAVDRAMEIGEIHLVHKSGGRSGRYARAADAGRSRKRRS